MNDCSLSLRVLVLLLLVDGRGRGLTSSRLQPEWCSAPPTGNGQCAPCGACETLPSRSSIQSSIIQSSIQSSIIQSSIESNDQSMGLVPSTDKLTAMAWLISEPLYCCVYKSSSTTFAVCSTPDCPSIPGYTLASSSPVQDCGSCKAPTGAASIRIIAEDEH